MRVVNFGFRSIIAVNMFLNVVVFCVWEGCTSALSIRIATAPPSSIFDCPRKAALLLLGHTCVRACMVCLMLRFDSSLIH